MKFAVYVPNTSRHFSALKYLVDSLALTLDAPVVHHTDDIPNDVVPVVLGAHAAPVHEEIVRRAIVYNTEQHGYWFSPQYRRTMQLARAVWCVFGTVDCVCPTVAVPPGYVPGLGCRPHSTLPGGIFRGYPTKHRLLTLDRIGEFTPVMAVYGAYGAQLPRARWELCMHLGGHGTKLESVRCVEAIADGRAVIAEESAEVAGDWTSAIPQGLSKDEVLYHVRHSAEVHEQQMFALRASPYSEIVREALKRL